MLKALHIATSPLTNNIYAGTLTKGNRWGSNKSDLTVQALVAVAEHVLKLGEPCVISTSEGVPVYEISVIKLNKLGE